jgi:hypothetical protein
VARWVPLPAPWAAKPPEPWSSQRIHVASNYSVPDRSVLFGHGICFALLFWKLGGGDAIVTSRGMATFRRFQLDLPVPNCAVFALELQPSAKADVRVRHAMEPTDAAPPRTSGRRSGGTSLPGPPSAAVRLLVSSVSIAIGVRQLQSPGPCGAARTRWRASDSSSDRPALTLTGHERAAIRAQTEQETRTDDAQLRK